MKKLLSGLCASTLAFSLAASSMLPANAAPMFVPERAPALEIQNVQSNGEVRRLRRALRQDRRGDRREARRERREDRRDRRVERRGDGYYYNGRRGYRYARQGYREYNGFWFPAAAFLAGAIVTGAVNSQPRVVVRQGGSHVDWCYNRYRSYRAYDNTFQPYNGGRQLCYSPYR